MVDKVISRNLKLGGGVLTNVWGVGVNMREDQILIKTKKNKKK